MTTVADIMSADLLTFQVSTTAGETIQRLVDRGFSAAPVLSGEKLVGFVSELDRIIIANRL